MPDLKALESKITAVKAEILAKSNRIKQLWDEYAVLSADRRKLWQRLENLRRGLPDEY